MSAYVQTVVGSDSPPVGAVMDFAGNVEPSGWLFCFGQSLPRTGIYAQLFSVIGTLYGSVDGLSFSLPDFRGRVGAGKDNMGGTAANRLQTAWGVDGATLGANGGGQSHQLTTAQLPSHTHGFRLISGSGTAIGAAGTTLWRTDGFASDPTGGDGAHPNVQPTFVVNKIIKYIVSGTVLPIVPGEGDVVGPDGGVADGDLVVFNGTSGKFIRRGSLFLRGHLAGLGMANNATDAVNDIDISEGQCRDSTNTVDIVLPAGITKRLDAAWAVGTGQGGLDTGAIANSTYHVFLIRRSDTGVVDALFSLSATAPTLPTNYIHFRRIGSIMRIAGVISAFIQIDDSFFWVTPVYDVSVTNQGTSSINYTLSVPTAFKFKALLNAGCAHTNTNLRVYLRDPDTADLAPSGTAAPLANLQVSSVTGTIRPVQLEIFTNTSGQVAARADSSTMSLRIATLGWTDTRGKG